SGTGGIDWGKLATTAVTAANTYSASKNGGTTATSYGGGSNIWESILAGVGTAAGGIMDEKTAKEVAKQGRQTLDFAASLKDFYDQKDKVRKRAALDTYGQFSTMDRWAPNAVAAPPIEQPARPGVG
ncbi:MAG TPA: hypothetical protein V6D20_02720, partial [Candidatus Obscuribacterales bacterium]